MYINGSPYSLGWDWAVAPEMVPVTQTPGMFWSIQYYTAGDQIKIAPGLEKQAYSLEFDRSATIDWVVRALGLIIDKPIKTEGGAYYIE